MAMGRRGGGRQKVLFVAAAGIRAPGHPFYRALDGMLAEAGFDGLCEETCAAYYAERLGRPSVAPGVYFRMLVVGYLEGIGSERGIAWRCAESLSLREFLGYELDENPPDHSTVSRTRRRPAGGGARGSVRPGAGALGGERASERQDAGDRLDDAGGERGDAVDRAAGHGGGIPAVPGGLGRGVGDRDAEPCGSGEAGPEAAEEGEQRGLGAPARPGRADHEDEGRADAHGP